MGELNKRIGPDLKTDIRRHRRELGFLLTALAITSAYGSIKLIQKHKEQHENPANPVLKSLFAVLDTPEIYPHLRSGKTGQLAARILDLYTTGEDEVLKLDNMNDLLILMHNAEAKDIVEMLTSIHKSKESPQFRRDLAEMRLPLKEIIEHMDMKVRTKYHKIGMVGYHNASEGLLAPSDWESGWTGDG